MRRCYFQPNPFGYGDECWRPLIIRAGGSKSVLFVARWLNQSQEIWEKARKISRAHGYTIPGSICWWDAEPGQRHLLLFWYWSSSAALAWSATFYGLAIFFNYPHYMATLYRAYHTADDFRKYRIFTVHITALILLTLVLSHFSYRAFALAVHHLSHHWSPWHAGGQNYGLFMMFARRAGAKPSETGRQLLYSAFLCSYLILFLTFHTGASQDPLFISLGILEKSICHRSL